MRQFLVYLTTAVILLLIGCKKYLEKPTTNNITTIDSLTQCEWMLNNIELLGNNPMAGELSSDNHYFRPGIWQELSFLEKNLYMWKEDIFEGQGNFRDYDNPYKQIYLANVVLQALKNIHTEINQQEQLNYVEGASLFYRGSAFYNLLQLFARPYKASTSATDTGIALRLSPDISVSLVRATMKASYEQVIADLQKAAVLLPHYSTVSTKHKPSKIASFAMLARVNVSMRNYQQALIWADSCLKYYNLLLDYNTCPTTKPFTRTNPEIIFQAFLDPSYTLIRTTQNTDSHVDSALFNSYAATDLRKILYYQLSSNGKPLVNGSYTGGVYFFGGIATDELYLIRAECYARTGLIMEAMATLNQLLIKRYKTNSFIPLEANSAAEALEKILVERRKELVFRGLRWTDLRRLGIENRQGNISRLVNGNIYTLRPNDLRYTLPIPNDALNGSQIVQNPRY